MNKKTSVIILGVVTVVIAGLLLLRSNHQPSKPEARASSPWKTVTLTSDSISFRVPPSWKITEDDTESMEPPQNIVVLSPTTDNHYFSLEISSGTLNDIYPDFFGTGKGITLLKLDIPKANQQFYTVAKQTADNKIAGVSLATTPGSDNTSFGIIDKSGGKHNITMSAVLHDNTPTTAPQTFSFNLYQSQPEYQNLLAIFKTLSMK
jgi:hypothetical protein